MCGSPAFLNSSTQYLKSKLAADENLLLRYLLRLRLVNISISCFLNKFCKFLVKLMDILFCNRVSCPNVLIFFTSISDSFFFFNIDSISFVMDCIGLSWDKLVCIADKLSVNNVDLGGVVAGANSLIGIIFIGR